MTNLNSMRLIHMRISLFSMILAAVLAWPTSAPAETTSETSGVVLDRIVALVDEGVVLQSELDRQVDMVSRQLREQGTRMPPPQVMRQQILESLIVQQVQMQRADRLGIRIADEQVNMALQRVAERNEISFSRLPEVLAAEGVDYAAFRQQLRREMIIDALRQRDVVARIAVTEREIARWLEQQEATRGSQVDYDISQILVALPEDPTPQQLSEAQARAAEIHGRLVEGADFAELAVASSAGPQALSGGHLGWRRGSQLPPQFTTVIQSLSAGDISEPVRSSSGFHIFRVNATRGGDEKVVELQTKARHILLVPNEVLDAATIRGRLEAIRERILKGESFADIAMLESEDPSSAARGGDLGWNPPGTFVPEFEAQLDRLTPGEISEPFASPFGWHIIRLEDRQERDTTDELKRIQAIQAIRASKQEQETELWLRRLRDEAWVEIRGG
jgi:peptidyl-prolyl cis-trans isomerase SurA